jgi:hypothetical protein
MAHHLDGQRIFPGRGIRLEDRPYGGNGDRREDKGRYDGPDHLDRGVAVRLVGLSVARFSAEPEDGVEQDTFHEDEYEESPPYSGIQQVVGDLGEIPTREKRGLRILIGAASRQHYYQQAERGDPAGRAPGNGPEEHFTRSSCGRIRRQRRS